MKYYIYVSDTKVDMLYSQIPRGVKDKIAAELRINLKFVDASFKEKSTEETRYSKLRLVIDHIEKNLSADVGTVDSPKAYIQGICPMRWGLIEEFRSTNRRVVYFAGTCNDVLVGLGGSVKHLIGIQPDSLPDLWLASALPFIIEVFAKEFDPQTPGDVGPIHRSDDESSLVRRINEIALRNLRGPDQVVEFFAKTLCRESTGRPSILATPIYVALAE